MPSRREFLGILSLLPVLGVKGTLVHHRECPTESVQCLIQQVRFLEQGIGNQAHIKNIEDCIRMRLLLAGLACIYVEDDGQSYICALNTREGSLWRLSVQQSCLPWARQAWKEIGLDGLGDRIMDLPLACDI